MTKTFATVFILIKVSSCSSEEVKELGHYADESSCEAIASALSETNRNDWLGRKGLDRFVCVPSTYKEPRQ